MTLALGAVDAALYAALRTRAYESDAGPSPTAPFARVARAWLPFDPKLLSLATPGPAVLLVWGRVRPEIAVATALGEHEAHAADTWTIVVAVDDSREIDDALVSGANWPSIYDLVDLVLETVHGLAVDGSWHGRRVRVAEYGPNAALSKRGSVYAADIVVTVDRSLPAVTDAPQGEALELGEGTAGPEGAEDLVHASIDFTDG